MMSYTYKTRYCTTIRPGKLLLSKTMNKPRLPLDRSNIYIVTTGNSTPADTLESPFRKLLCILPNTLPVKLGTDKYQRCIVTQPRRQQCHKPSCIPR